VPRNKSLQRSGTHKVLARGRVASLSTRGALARTTCRRAAAELCRYAASSIVVLTALRALGFREITRRLAGAVI
jgi:hypothetical protein